MKIVHLQFAPFSAGRAAIRLHNAFREENIESHILSLHYDINDTPEMTHLSLRSVISAWVDNKIQSYLTRNNYKQFGQYSYPIIGTNISKNRFIQDADIIYVHWVQGGFLNLSNIEQLAKLGKPIIFFMHDMWTITGGCHHSFTCEKYKSKCSNCQMFPEKSMVDLPAIEFNNKLKLYSKYTKLYFVAPSRWLYNCAKESFLTKDKNLNYIPNVINNDLFRPINKNVARDILNIDINDTVLAFGAVSVDSPYKGWSYLQNALKIFKKSQSSNKISVLIFGSGHNKKIADSIPFETKFVGFLRDEYSISLVYNATDVFIAPSLAETFGFVIMEALSCATPVVGFDVGGIPDLIVHKENGYLAKYKDAEDMAAGIEYCLKNKIKGKLLPIFEKRNIIKKHIELIDSIMSS